ESFFCALRPIPRILSLQDEITRIKFKAPFAPAKPAPAKPEASPFGNTAPAPAVPFSNVPAVEKLSPSRSEYPADSHKAHALPASVDRTRKVSITWRGGHAGLPKGHEAGQSSLLASDRKVNSA